MTERPVLRAIIAKPIYGGKGAIGRTRIVPLSTAFLAMRAGFVVVGPDPDDLIDLQRWEREQPDPCEQPDPFNQIRRVW